MTDKQRLVDKCIDQIKDDIRKGDVTALDELLMLTDENLLKGYLAEDDDDRYFFYPITLDFEHEGNAIRYTIVPEESDWWESDGKFDYHYCEDYNQVCVYVVKGDMFCQSIDSKPIHSQPIRKGGNQ